MQELESARALESSEVEYVPKEQPEFVFIPKKGEEEKPLWRSNRFWLIGIASCASVLVRLDFNELPWNQIIGQILILWFGPAAAVGTWDKTIKTLKNG